jgi:hypothetical protein
MKLTTGRFGGRKFSARSSSPSNLAMMHLIDIAVSLAWDEAETDNEGQLVIYTGVYRWADGSYHTEAESK